MNLQLTIDGAEVAHPAPSPSTPLTEAQRLILRYVGEHGEIRSSEAGAIVHECSAPAHHAAVHGALDFHLRSRRCYRAADGLEACKRLAARGLLVRAEPGRWRSPTGAAA